MKLENACLCVEIAEKGAELTRIFNKKTGAEILWNGDPQFWSRHSPVLFPNVGKPMEIRYSSTEYNIRLPSMDLQETVNFAV